MQVDFKGKLVKYQDGYLLLLKVPNRTSKFSLENEKKFNHISVFEFKSYGVLFGYFFKPLKQVDIFEDDFFIAYKESQKDEKPERKFANQYYFLYESETGFYLGLKVHEKARKGDF